MTQKTFKIIRMVTAFFLAAVMAQAVIFSNYILAFASVAAAVAVILIIRRKVNEVLVDERIIQIGGKAARTSLSIFSVAITAIIFVLMLFREVNPIYELIGSVLGYSICALLLLYSAAFYFYEKQN